MRRRWDRVTVVGKVYCSSSQHYFADVILWQGDRRAGPINYCINNGSYGERFYKLPKYVREMIRSRLHEKFTTGQLTIVEGTRDGGERTDNLRYHLPEILEAYLKPK